MCVWRPCAQPPRGPMHKRKFCATWRTNTCLGTCCLAITGSANNWVFTPVSFRRTDSVPIATIAFAVGLTGTETRTASSQVATMDSQFPYGEQPIDQAFDEHRIWQQLITKAETGALKWLHRYASNNAHDEGIGSTWQHRARYCASDVAFAQPTCLVHQCLRGVHWIACLGAARPQSFAAKPILGSQSQARRGHSPPIGLPPASAVERIRLGCRQRVVVGVRHNLDFRD